MFMKCTKIPSSDIKKTKIRVKIPGKELNYKKQNSLMSKPDNNRIYHQTEILDSVLNSAKNNNKTIAHISNKTKKLYSTNTKPNFNKTKKIIHKSRLSAHNTNKNKFELKESKMQINPMKTSTNFYKKQNNLKYTTTEPELLKKFSQVDNNNYMRSGSVNIKENNKQYYDNCREMAFIRTNSMKQNDNIKKNIDYNKSNKNKTNKKL